MTTTNDTIILKFIGCSTPATLCEQLNIHMPSAPNVDLLHEIFHAVRCQAKQAESNFLLTRIP
jgi:hypothetical protein